MFTSCGSTIDVAWSYVLCSWHNDCLQSVGADIKDEVQASEQNARKLELTSTHEQDAKRLRMSDGSDKQKLASRNVAASNAYVQPRTFCRTVRRVTLTGEVKD